jgi:hypothetical protein
MILIRIVVIADFIQNVIFQNVWSVLIGGKKMFEQRKKGEDNACRQDNSSIPRKAKALAYP